MAGKGSLTFKPIKGLSISGIVSPFINYQKKKAFKKSCGYTLPDDPETFGGYFDSGSTWTTNSLTETRNDDYNVTSQAIANYMGTFGSHNLTVMAGFENYYMKSEKFEIDQYCTLFPIPSQEIRSNPKLTQNYGAR